MDFKVNSKIGIVGAIQLVIFIFAAGESMVTLAKAMRDSFIKVSGLSRRHGKAKAIVLAAIDHLPFPVAIYNQYGGLWAWNRSWIIMKQAQRASRKASMA